MNQELQRLCEEYIAARDTVGRVFKLEYDVVYPVCANIFLSHGVRAEEERLRACREMIKDNAGVFSSFRGSVYAPCASMLACGSDPERRMAQAAENYRMLKEYFSSGETLVLASMLLTDMAAPEEAREKAERGRAIYQKMKEKHRFLTGQEDSVFAVLMAFSEKSDDAMIDEMEQIFTALDGMAGKDYLQSAAQILAMSDKPAEEKTARFKELFEALRAAGIKYGKSYELAVLASLSLKDVPIDRLVQDIADISGDLATRKGFKGLFGMDKKTRYMHAAMLATTYYSPSVEGDVAALASMVSIVAIQMIITMIIVMNAAHLAAMSH